MLNKIKNIFAILGILAILCLGFLFGRYTTTPVVNTEYIKGDTIRDTIYQPKPYRVVEPIDTINLIKQWIKDGVYSELWPTRIITEYIEIEKADSSKIIKDWTYKRLYNEILFNNDTIGFCSINAEVQYNRLRLLNYVYQPVIKQTKIEIDKSKIIEPFIGINLMTNPWDEIVSPMLGISGGVYLNKHYGLMVQYQRSLKEKNDYIGGGIYYKF